MTLGDQVPARGLSVIDLRPVAVGIDAGKAELRDRVVGLGRAREPGDGGGLVLRNAAPGEENDRVFDLGADMAALGSRFAYQRAACFSSATTPTPST